MTHVVEDTHASGQDVTHGARISLAPTRSHFASLSPLFLPAIPVVGECACVFGCGFWLKFIGMCVCVFVPGACWRNVRAAMP